MIFGGRPTTGRPALGSDRAGRNKVLSIRISEADLKRLKRVSAFFGLTQTDYIISMIREGEEEMKRNEKR